MPHYSTRMMRSGGRRLSKTSASPTNRPFPAAREPAENVYRDATVALARRQPFARSLVNTGRMSVPNTYTRLAIQCRDAAVDGPSPTSALTLPDGSPGNLAQLQKWARAKLVALVRDPSDRHRALERAIPCASCRAEAGRRRCAALADAGGNVGRDHPPPGSHTVAGASRSATRRARGRLAVAVMPMIDADGWYEELMNAHHGLSDRQSVGSNCALVLLLADRVADRR